MVKNTLKTLIVMVALAACTTLAQKPYVEAIDDLEISQARLVQNRAPQHLKQVFGLERVAVKSKQTPLLETFRGTKNNVVGDGIWKERGIATLWYDAEGKLINIEIENSAGANLEEKFGKMCEENALYQLQLPDFDLITTQPACTYKDRGLNETLTFFTDDQGSNLISFSYNLIDYEYLATKEKSAKTRRLMTTPEWESFKTSAGVSVPEHGTRPTFSTKNYDSKGHEKKEAVEEKKEKEAEQSFIGKYWMWIMIAFMVLPRLLGDGGAPESAAGAPQRTGRAAPVASR